MLLACLRSLPTRLPMWMGGCLCGATSCSSQEPPCLVHQQPPCKALQGLEASLKVCFGGRPGGGEKGMASWVHPRNVLADLRARWSAQLFLFLLTSLALLLLCVWVVVTRPCLTLRFSLVWPLHLLRALLDLTRIAISSMSLVPLVPCFRSALRHVRVLGCWKTLFSACWRAARLVVDSSISGVTKATSLLNKPSRCPTFAHA